jgi:hypothetical protein
VNETLVELLQSGGDHRLQVDADGLSPYRASSQPTAQLPFASCTASSMGQRGWRAVQQVFAERPDDDGAWVEALNARTRAELATVFELGPDASGLAAETALLPSGTDALYLVSCMALAHAERVHHIVVGAGELGSGTHAACEGRSFSPGRPLGIGPEGEALPELADRCSAESVYLRDHAGRRRSIATIDAEVHDRVIEALQPGTSVVVHLVDHSKTGLRAPSLQLVERLIAQHGRRVLVLVDAAQGRLAPADIRRALQAGFVVMFTGSKFYSGPPFSCALFLPRNWADDPGPLPGTLSHWFSRADLPTAWTRARGSLAHAANPGLAVRWVAALAEILPYHAIPPRRRAGVYATFAGAVHEVLGSHPTIDLEFPIPPVHALASRLASFPNVFGFRVRHGDGWLDKAALKRVHARLDTPMATYDPVLQTRYHIGQPVVLGPPTGERVALLRVALGARMVTDLADRPDAGGAWIRQQLQGMMEKLDAILAEGVP